MGNALACSAANASLELIQQSNIEETVTNIEQWLKTALAPCESLDMVQNVRCLGAIGVVELKQAVDLHQIQPLFVEQGVWIRPFGKLIYLMPPYIIQEDEIKKLGHAIYTVINQHFQ
jgi:adenosylmethionine-8-amino-7-oxononanoate aminotransferase